MCFTKNKLSRNAELIITCIILLVLCFLGYLISLVVNCQPTEELDKKTVIINELSNVGPFLTFLSDSLSSSLIIWSLIGFISNYAKINKLKTSKIPPYIALPTFVIYLIWYITYFALKNIFFELVIANLVVFVFVLIVFLLFFNEYERK